MAVLRRPDDTLISRASPRARRGKERARRSLAVACSDDANLASSSIVCGRIGPMKTPCHSQASILSGHGEVPPLQHFRLSFACAPQPYTTSPTSPSLRTTTCITSVFSSRTSHDTHHSLCTTTRVPPLYRLPRHRSSGQLSLLCYGLCPLIIPLDHIPWRPYTP